MFLVGPVQQPILSMGRLEADFSAVLDTRKRVLVLDGDILPVQRILRSYHIPAWVVEPTEDDQRRQVRQVKRIAYDLDQGLVKFKLHLKSELEDHPRRKSRAETEPRGEEPAKASRTKRSGEPVKEELRACKPEAPAETRGVKEVSRSLSRRNQKTKRVSRRCRCRQGLAR